MATMEILSPDGSVITMENLSPGGTSTDLIEQRGTALEVLSHGVRPVEPPPADNGIVATLELASDDGRVINLEIVTAEEGVNTIFGLERTFIAYRGAKAKDASDPATKVNTGPVPINVILGLLHMQQIGGCTNVDIVNLVNHMTPGLKFFEGYGSPLQGYAHDVCMPELRRQHPDIFAEPLPADGNLAAFYAAMVEKYGKTVEVKSIAKPIA